MSEAIIYTDGSSDKNRNGGWSAIVARPSSLTEITGWESNTTNNRMEMMAAVKGLQELKEPHRVMLVSDSAYLLNTLKNKWHLEWFDVLEKTGYRRPNLDLWLVLGEEVIKHEMVYVKVKGHSKVEWNERADRLAVAARKGKLEIRHESPKYERFDLRDSRIFSAKVKG